MTMDDDLGWHGLDAHAGTKRCRNCDYLFVPDKHESYCGNCTARAIAPQEAPSDA